jgi:transcriptional regulator with XRE-family HTH domain
MDTTPHVHPDALAALIGLSALSKQQVAMGAGMTPSQLSDLLAGRRPGRDEGLRRRIARALGVPVAAITCPCPSEVAA